MITEAGKNALRAVVEHMRPYWLSVAGGDLSPAQRAAVEQRLSELEVIENGIL